MPTVLSLAVASILIVTFVRHTIRTAWYGVTLSNNVDVLVSPSMYEEIIERFRTSDVPDPEERWDRAILSVIRAERPHEWRFLARTLGREKSAKWRQQRRQAVAVSMTPALKSEVPL